MEIVEKYSLILKKASDEDIGILYFQAIKALGMVECRADAKAAVTLVSPFFVSTVFGRLDKEKQKELRVRLDEIEGQYGSLVSEILG